MKTKERERDALKWTGNEKRKRQTLDGPGLPSQSPVGHGNMVDGMIDR